MTEYDGRSLELALIPAQLDQPLNHLFHYKYLEYESMGFGYSYSISTMTRLDYGLPGSLKSTWHSVQSSLTRYDFKHYKSSPIKSTSIIKCLSDIHKSEAHWSRARSIIKCLSDIISYYHYKSTSSTSPELRQSSNVYQIYANHYTTKDYGFYPFPLHY